jgi:hypothetical protein
MSNVTKSDFFELLRLGFPVSIFYILNFLPGMLMLAFLSTPDELAGAGMGFMYSNVTGMAVIVGFGAGSSPLISQGK